MDSKVKEIIKELESKKNLRNIEGMSRFGIRPKSKVLGISIPDLRKVAKRIGKNHEIALELWKSNIHEAQLLAGFIGDPDKLTEQQMEEWIKDFDSWDIVDQVCSNIFDKTRFAYKKINEFQAESSKEK